MTQTLDANILVFSSDESSPFRDRARVFLRGMMTKDAIVHLFWPTVMAYLRITTHPNVFRAPLSIDQALTNVQAMVDQPNVRVSSEGIEFWSVFRDVASDGRPAGNLVSDAHLVALMRQHGVRTIWTHDRDFRRFRGIDVRDPFA